MTASMYNILCSLDRLGQCANLIDLKQQGIARLQLNCLLDADGVRDSQVISDNLEIRRLVEVAPGLPVILSKWILDAHNGVLLGELFVLVCQLLICEPFGWIGVFVLEVQIVFLRIFLVELAGGHVHGDVHLSGVSSFLDGIGDELKCLIGSCNVRGDTALVANIAGGVTILLLGERLELLVDFGALAHSLAEGRCGTDLD